MPIMYTVVGPDGMIRLSNITDDPSYSVREGERLLVDSPPERGELQKIIRVEPVPMNATQVVYELVDDTAAIQAKQLAGRKCTSLQFMERFTDAEQLSIAEATLASAQVKLWYDKLLAAGEVNFDDQRTQLGMSMLVSSGLISLERSIQILPPYVV